MTSLTSPKVNLKLTPVLKTIVYAGLAGELVRNTGMTDLGQIGALQHCVSDGLVARVIVRGRHADGREETYTLAMKPFAVGDTVSLLPEPGKSYCEMIDVALAAGVQYAADQIRRLGLTPRFEVDWSLKARANPRLVADAARRLNVKAPPELAPPLALPPTLPSYVAEPRPVPTAPRFPQTVHTYTAPPALPVGYVRTTVVEIKPEKDPGITFTIATTRKA